MTDPASPRPDESAATRKRSRRQAGGRRSPRNVDGPQHDESFEGPSAPKRSVELLLRMAIHEAGHAVARLYLGLGVIEQITLDVPEGGGITWRIERHDDSTEERLTAELVATLAGRAAEEVVLGNVAAHCGGQPYSDLALATDLAFRMETTLGFGQKWPLLYRSATDRTLLLAQDPDLADLVHARLESAHGAARAIVSKQKEAVEFLAAHLLNHGTFDGPRLTRILEKVRERLQE